MNYLTNYVFLMKRLVSSSKDVELLVVEHGIVQNWIGIISKRALTPLRQNIKHMACTFIAFTYDPNIQPF
ncbi:hypothetical protein GBA52_001101 [Prunus armeniaca]|nr:hypothetical protein GBA52_001101 [Prunus armeniaca]